MNEKNKFPISNDPVEISRYFSAVLEDMRSQFRVFGEGQQLLLDRVTAIESRLDKIENRLDKIEGRLDKIEVEIMEIKRQLMTKVSVDEYNKLEQRVISLEKLIPAQ